MPPSEVLPEDDAPEREKVARERTAIHRKCIKLDVAAFATRYPRPPSTLVLSAHLRCDGRTREAKRMKSRDALVTIALECGRSTVTAVGRRSLYVPPGEAREVAERT